MIVELGDRHLDDLLTIADPLVVTDLPTLLWSPHGHPEAVAGAAAARAGDAARLGRRARLARGDRPRARRSPSALYVVDLAWLRSTPWRERIAATFDPPALRCELERISLVTIRHHPDSTVAAMLLIGWLASRLGWRLSPLQADGERARAARRRPRASQEIALRLQAAPEQQVRGLAGLSIETASGIDLRLDRGTGGLRAYQRDARG